MVDTYKMKFNRKHKQPLGKSNSITEISKLSGYKRSGLQTIYNKGVGAFKTTGPSRPNMTKESWGMSRIYASVNKSSKAYALDKIHLKK